jgi:LPXTG-motif cell wall-anchored protein
MTDVIVLAVILAIIGGAIWYIRSKKKKGAVCIGCPHAHQCGGNCSSGCSCH